MAMMKTFFICFVLILAIIHAGSGSEVSTKSVLNLVQCIVESIYFREAPTVTDMPRKMLVESAIRPAVGEDETAASVDVMVHEAALNEREDEEKQHRAIVNAKEMQLDYFLNAHFDLMAPEHGIVSNGPHNSILTCLKNKDKQIYNALGYVLPQYFSWISKNVNFLYGEYVKIGKKDWFFANRGSADFGTRTDKYPKLLKFWRRLPIPHGLALENAFYLVAIDLLGKMRKHEKISAEIEAVNEQLKNELDNNELLMRFTYHNYYMGNGEKWKDIEEDDSEEEKKAKIAHNIALPEYFYNIYTANKAKLVEQLEHVKVIVGEQQQQQQQQGQQAKEHAGKIEIPQAKLVIWTILQVAGHRANSKYESINKEQIHAMNEAVKKFFSQIPLSKIYSTRSSVKGKERTNKEIEDMAKKIKEANKDFENIKHEIIEEDSEKKQLYQRLNKDGDGDDADIFNVIDVFQTIVKNSFEAGAGTSGAEHVHPKKPAAKNEMKVAPGEENATHVLLITDLGANLAAQQLFDGKYKYPAQGTISKYVVLANPNKRSTHLFTPPGDKAQPILELDNIRLISGGLTTHLWGEKELNTDKFKELYFTK